MYNQDQKIQFIDELNESDLAKKNTINLFKRLDKKVESQFEKDFCDFSYDEAKLGVVLLGGKSISSISWHLSMLKQYYDWCIINGRTDKNENPLDGVCPEDIDNSYIYKVEMLKNPEHLEKIMNAVYAPVEESPLSNIYRLYMWLIYYGLTPMEAAYLETKDVNLHEKIITPNEKVIYMPDQIFELIDYVMDDTYMEMRRNAYIKIKFVKSKYLLNAQKENNFRRSIKFNRKIISLNLMYKNITGQYIKLSPERIFDSGLFYRWKQLEEKGGKIPFEDYISSIMVDKEYSNNINYVYNRKIKLIKTSYETWKKAFDLV